ncbi:WD40 repeat-like protein [Paxillus ammoniavirescens]|nr:WD40 repeat-like protein [Paxillus ammoniavirescens]
MPNASTKSVDLTPKPLLTISGHEDYVNGIAYLPGEERLVTFAHDGTIRIWNVENGEQEGTAMEHDGRVEGFAVTKDGKRIFSGDEDKLLRVWDAETHEPIAEWGGHEGFICCIATSPDDQLVASGDYEGRIIIREMNLEDEDGRTKHAIETGPRSVYSICFSPDGTKLASGHRDNMIRVFDVETGELVLGPMEGHTNWVNSVVWSLDGTRLFTASDDHFIRFWDSETGQPIGEPLTGHTGYIISIALSPDGTKLASASGDKTVRFWDTDSGDPIGEPLQHEDYVWAVTFSPSGEFVACGESGGKVSIWRVPWWDDSKKAHKSLLDLPAVPVPRHIPSGGGRQPDYLDLPTTRRPSSPRPPLRTTSATEVPSRTQRSAFSWRVWRIVSRQVFGRSHSQPRRAELTTVYSGFATQRVYVASRDGESTPESRTEPLPTAPGHYPGFSIIVESTSSTDGLDVNQQTPAPPDSSGRMQVSCCALFSRRRARTGTGTPSVPPAIELSELAGPTSDPPVPGSATPSHPTAQKALDLPAVAEPPLHAP